MASFYNPYQKGPDFGQGIGDIAQQIMQILMMKKMFPGQQTQETQMPGQMPSPRFQGGALSSPNPMGQAPGSMPEQGLDPQMLMMLMKMLGGGGAGIPGFAGGGIVTKPTFATVGERGPEAIVPLGRGGFNPSFSPFRNPMPGGGGVGYNRPTPFGRGDQNPYLPSPRPFIPRPQQFSQQGQFGLLPMPNNPQIIPPAGGVIPTTDPNRHW